MNKEIDIRSEEYRVYHYPDGSTVTIPAPETLYVIEDEKGATHRVVDAGGITYRPERGWNCISWKPKPGAPSFVA